MGYTSVEAASYKDGMLYGQTPEQFRKDVEMPLSRVISTHCALNLSDEERRRRFLEGPRLVGRVHRGAQGRRCGIYRGPLDA